MTAHWISGPAVLAFTLALACGGDAGPDDGGADGADPGDDAGTVVDDAGSAAVDAGPHVVSQIDPCEHVVCGPASTCEGGSCRCIPGFHECNGSALDGCETDLTVDGACP